MKRYKKEELLPICPVCGYDKLDEAPFDEFGFPTYEICSCCGFEFGFDDESEGYSYEEYRKKWIEGGFKFFNKSKKPIDWSEEKMRKQLENIKKVKYKPRYF